VPDPDEEVRLNRRELDRLRQAATEVREQALELEDELTRRERELEKAQEAREVAERAAKDTRDLERSNQQLLDKIHRLEPENRHLRHRAETAERALDRLKNRRLVRLALTIAQFFRPLFQLVRAFRDPGSLPPPPAFETPEAETSIADEERTRIQEQALARILRESLEGPTRRDGPHVSIVVLNRDGQHHLRRLMPGLERTDYASFDVTVVDNDSSDGSLAYLDRLQPSFPLRVVRNEHNASFAAANNQGIAASDGELVLLLNNDIEPITGTWLARMVCTLEEWEVAAVGARLIYPHRPALDDNVGDTVHPDLTLQHRGIHFDHGDDGIPRPRNLGTGEDPLTAAAGAVRDVPAVTAACMLVRRDALEEVGGLCEDYVYGTEDVDLCLLLTHAGHRVVYDGQAALWHHEFGTQNQEGREFKAENRRRNREVFVGRWGPRLYRQVLADRIRADRRWSAEPLRVAVLGGLPASEGAGPAELGWEVRHLRYPDEVDASYDVAVVTRRDVDVHAIAHEVVTVGLVPAGSGPAWATLDWFDDLALVLAEDERDAKELVNRRMKQVRERSPALSVAEDLREALIDWCEARRIGVLISTPGRDVAERWGDTHYARGLQRWFERSGHPAEVVIRSGIDAPWSARTDVALLLLGLSEHDPRPGQVSVLWNISHPELVTPEFAGRFDTVFVASRRFAETLAAQVVVPVLPLHQATDPDRFRPTPGGPDHELLFVANSRRTRRPIVDALTPSPFDLAIYGGDWYPELADPGDVRGEVVPNEELPAWYAGAGVVLNDHWPEMREHGYISNRLYDVLAAGGFVVSDELEGLEEEFDGAVVTYRDREDLLDSIGRFLADPEARRAHVQRGRRAVLERHTFGHRVATITEVIAPLLDAQPAWIHVPSDPEAAGIHPDRGPGHVRSDR
jgi:GT2 family glycosyltransferase